MVTTYRRLRRAWFVGVAAVLVLSVTIGNSSGNNLSVSNRNIRIVWTGLKFIAGGETIACHLTLEGSFAEATIRKVVSTLMGRITTATVNTCTGGSATILNETLPWHLRYNGFSGTLPRMTAVGLLLVGMSWRYRPEGFLACLLATTEAHPAKFSASVSAGTITGLTTLAEAEIPLTGEGGLCAFGGEAHYEGTGTVTLLGATTVITIRLI